MLSSTAVAMCGRSVCSVSTSTASTISNAVRIASIFPASTLKAVVATRPSNSSGNRASTTRRANFAKKAGFVVV